MKPSIRTKFAIGIVFFFVIILLLSAFSAFYLNRLAKKTGAILKENHLSVVYARNMSESLMGINQEITNCFLTNKNVDSLLVYIDIQTFDKSLQLEKNNITEVGEDKIASSIESGFLEYRDSVVKYAKSPKSVAMVLFLQKESRDIYQQLGLLSQINEKAIEVKTDDAKVSAKNALAQMLLLGTICFIITLGFTYNFASYFNERFFQLYNGIKEIVSSNYGQRLHFEGKDEFHEISLVFNEMAQKLNENQQKTTVTLHEDTSSNDLHELKRILIQMKNIEEEAKQLMIRLENRK